VTVNLDSDDELFPSGEVAAASQATENAQGGSGDKYAEPGFDVDLSEDRQSTNTPPITAPMSPTNAVGGIAGAARAEPTPVFSDDGKFIYVTIGDAQKVGDGMNAFMTFKVTTKTNLTYFKASVFSVSRRFSDFLGLYEKLMEKHIQFGRIVPPPPEKNMSGMTKVKMGKEETQAGSEFLKRRRAALERFVNRCLDHNNLRNDPDMRDFLEREELPKASHTSALSSKSIMKKLNFAVDTAIAKAPTRIPMEQDQWYDMKQVQVENLETQLKKLVTNIEGLVVARQDLSSFNATFAKSVAMLGNTEEHLVLSRALSQLSEVQEKIEHLQQEQSANDFNLFCELMRDYVGLLRAVKEAFNQRARMWQAWQSSENTLLKKRETEGRLQLSGRTDKIPAVKAEIQQWTDRVAVTKQEFDNISENLKKEMVVFEEKRIAEFKEKLIKYLESLLNTQQTLVKHWEGYLPEAKSIV
jgi:sorting nexin-1/2